MQYLQKLKKDINSNDITVQQQSLVEITNVLSEISVFLDNRDEVKSLLINDSITIVKMMLSKFRHIIFISDSFETINNGSSNLPYDPSIIIQINRNIFETLVFYHQLFVKHNENEFQHILYLLWSISGIKYKQRAKRPKMRPQDIFKRQKELDLCTRQENEIKSSTFFRNLDDKSQNQINLAIKKKIFWVDFSDNKVNSSVGPQYLADQMFSNKNVLNFQYMYYSLYSHPSHVSVYQFAQYTVNNEPFILLTNLKATLMYISVFIIDVTSVFPSTIKFLDNLKDLTALKIQLYNNLLRDEND